MRRFVNEEVLPLEALAPADEETFVAIVRPLQAEVKAEGLWAAHLPPELGGQGFGQVNLALMHEVLGRSVYAPVIFGNQAPDSGNAELIALAGSPSQKERWLYPLLEGRIRSGFSMTEPEVAGSDPTLLRTTARRDDQGWVLNGHKWYTSNGSAADFLIVMAATEGDAGPHEAFSMFLVPTATPGVHIIRDIPTMEVPTGLASGFRAGGFGHAEIRYTDVRLTEENILGKPGRRFRARSAAARAGSAASLHAVAGAGTTRLRHALRALVVPIRARIAPRRQGHRPSLDRRLGSGTARRPLDDALCGLAARQGWLVDRPERDLDDQVLRRDRFSTTSSTALCRPTGVSATRLICRSRRCTGSLEARAVYDGPDEVHKTVVARRLLRRYSASEVPTEHVPTRHAAALEKFAFLLSTAIDNL